MSRHNRSLRRATGRRSLESASTAGGGQVSSAPREPSRIFLAIEPVAAGDGNHDAPAIPPKEFRLFRDGVNPSTKGDFLFDDKARKLVLAAIASWANRYPFDWGHGMLKNDHVDPAEGGKAAGQFTPALRGKELWATECNWTPKAREMIGNREWCYFSPAFNVDGDERVVELINCALTNLPAMHDIEPLVACSVVPYGAAPFVDSPWDGDAAVGRLRTWAGVDGEKPTPAQWKKYAKGFAIVRGSGDKLGDFALPHHDIVDGRFVTNIHGVDAARAALSGARGGVKDISPAERKAALAHLNRHRDAYDRQQKNKSPAAQTRAASRTHMDKEALHKAIHAMHEKMHGKMHDAEAKAALDEKLDEMSLAECQSYHDKLMGFMPKPAKDEPDGDEPEKPADKPKADAKKDKADGDGEKEDDEDEKRDRKASRSTDSDSVWLARIAAQDAKIAAMEAEKVADKRTALLDRALSDKKISPAERKGKGERGEFIASLSMDQLAKFISASKPLIDGETTQPTDGAHARNDGSRAIKVALSKGEAETTVTLDPGAVKICEETNGDIIELARQVGLQQRNARARMS